MQGRRPRVLAHIAVSIDGAISGFEPDVGRYYALASTWDEDVTLAGADTILAQESALAQAPRPGPKAEGPLLAVVDSRGRVSAWDALREAGHWADVVALRAQTAYGMPARELTTGGEQVDLAGALATLRERHGAELVRVDSGGALIGALLERRLVDELSLLVHPCVAAGERRWYGATRPSLALEHLASEELDGGLVWLRYRVPQS